MKKENGFTFIELVIVIGIFSFIGIIILTTIVNTLRSANKTTLLNTLRQNGNYAIGQMEKTIRLASSLQTPVPPCGNAKSSSALSVTASDGTITTYTCTANSITDTNGISLFDTSKTKVSGCNFTCTQPTTADSPVITIDFSLQTTSASNFNEQSANPIAFETTVVMRNITR